GEDYRYTLTGAGLEGWLPDLLAGCTGRDTLATLLGTLPETQRGPAREILERLYGERVLVDGAATAAHVGRRYDRRVTGTGTLAERLREELAWQEGPTR